MKYVNRLAWSGKIATVGSMVLLSNNALAVVGVPGASVPEPATVGLLAIGAVAGGAAYLRSKRRKK